MGRTLSFRQEMPFESFFPGASGRLPKNRHLICYSVEGMAGCPNVYRACEHYPIVVSKSAFISTLIALPCPIIVPAAERASFAIYTEISEKSPINFFGRTVRVGFAVRTPEKMRIYPVSVRVCHDDCIKPIPRGIHCLGELNIHCKASAFGHACRAEPMIFVFFL